MPRLPRLRERRPRALLVAGPPAILEVDRDGIVPLAVGARAPEGPLRVAVVVPSFRRGSGGHHTIADLVRGLEARGHRCSLWIEDLGGRHASEPPAQTADRFVEYFGLVAAPRYVGFAAWEGADVVLATGWQTVHRVLRLPGAGARAYLVQDHEPDFHGASAERMWAEATYRLGLHCIAASPWLATLLRERYGASATHFDLGVDHAAYRPRGGARDDDLVVFYARATTPRRAVPLALLALEELHRRRPATRIALFGDTTPVAAPFPHEQLGLLEPARLAELYSRAAVGLVLSLTNPSLVPTEMLACGLPCVDLAGPSMRTTFGADGPIALAEPTPCALAEVVERLLESPAERDRHREWGLALAAERTWAAAAGQLEQGLRAAFPTVAA